MRVCVCVCVCVYGPEKLNAQKRRHSVPASPRRRLRVMPDASESLRPGQTLTIISDVSLEMVKFSHASLTIVTISAWRSLASVDVARPPRRGPTRKTEKPSLTVFWTLLSPYHTSSGAATKPESELDAF